jgi:hypothetical protein
MRSWSVIDKEKNPSGLEASFNSLLGGQNFGFPIDSWFALCFCPNRHGMQWGEILSTLALDADHLPGQNVFVPQIITLGGVFD